MSRGQADKLTILKRRAEVADLRLKGRTLAQIADVLGLTYYAVRSDVRAVEREYMERTARAIEQRRAEKVAKLELVEREAWDAWDASKAAREKQKTRQTTGARGTTQEASLEREETGPDVAYLNAARAAIEAQARILGEFMPQKTALTDAEGNSIPMLVLAVDDPSLLPRPDPVGTPDAEDEDDEDAEDD